MPHHYIMTYNHILHEETTSDEEGGEMDYVLAFEDEDDDEDEDMDAEALESELPGLLTDAQKDIDEVVPQRQEDL